METAYIAMASLIAAAVCVSIAAFAAAKSDAQVATKAVESVARQPEAKNDILITMLIGIGMIESIPIIAAVIALALVFANPFVK
ncbi:MAG: ATP synthase F0 subunit C [Sporomusaceae bacterium]|nr:ATP synthase F0 subunit C [Sporomusaceae bacterium]